MNKINFRKKGIGTVNLIIFIIIFVAFFTYVIAVKTGRFNPIEDESPSITGSIIGETAQKVGFSTIGFSLIMVVALVYIFFLVKFNLGKK